MRGWFYSGLGLICIGILVGCGGGDDLAQTSSQPANSSNNNAANANAGANRNLPASAVAGGGAPAEGGEAQPAAPNRLAPGARRFNLPAAAVAGGGGASSQPAEPARLGAPGQNSGGNNNVAEVPLEGFTGTSMANGLFPQVPGSGNATASTGGALFPVSTGIGAISSSGSGGPVSAVAGGGPSANRGGAATVGLVGEGTMMSQAIVSFSDLKNENASMQMLYAHVLMDDRAAEQFPLKWIPALSEPRIAFRWGVGVVYSESKGFEGRHPVIGDVGGSDGGSAGAGSSGPGNAGLEGGGASPPAGASGDGQRKYQQIDTSRPDGVLIYYTGEFGEQLIDKLDKRRRHADAYFGQILKDIPLTEPKVSAEERAARQPARRRNPSRRGLPTGAVQGGGAANNQPEGGEDEDLGDEDAGGTRKAASKAIDRAMGTEDSEKPDVETVGTIIPGVMMLGVGKKSDLIAAAKQQGVDGLILFNVKATRSRNSGRTTSMTKMMIYNIQGDREEEWYTSSALKNTTADEKIADGNDPVRKIMDSAFNNTLDEVIRAQELPDALNEENVEKRVRSLMDRDASNPLPVAVEIVSYHRMGLLSGELAMEALDKVFGSEGAGQKLLSANPSARKSVIQQWIKAGASSDDDDL